MMQPLVYLITACVSVNILFIWLLISQRGERKDALSHHGAKSRWTYLIWVIGHSVGAAAFYLFAQSFFMGISHYRLIMILVVVGCTCEVIQALVPARNNLERYHNFFAYTMAWAVLAIGILASLFVPQQPWAKLTSTLLMMALSICPYLAHILNKQSLWKVQISSDIIFYAGMFVIYFGRI